MAEIFISYKSERRPAARHLAKILNAYGFDVWYDYGLLPGEDFALRLKSELKAAKAVIVLWCSKSTSSEWVIREATIAKRENKFLPCWIENTPLPKDFSDADTIDLTKWDGAPRSHLLDRLLGDISRRIGRAPVSNFNRLREIDEDWRDFGAPTLAQFALCDSLVPGGDIGQEQIQRMHQFLSEPSPLQSDNLVQHWGRGLVSEAARFVQVVPDKDECHHGLRDEEPDLVRLHHLAEKEGNAHAQYNLGWMYDHGCDGLQRDEIEAVRFYSMSAEQGDAYAQNNLAWMYLNGRGGLPVDEKKAVRLYRLSASQGHTDALFNLGWIHENGYGEVASDKIEAARYYRLATEKGNANAQCSLGRMYELGGGGLPRDELEAVHLYRLAAEQGQARAQNCLGWMYMKGLGGLPKDEWEAVRLFRLSAEQGDFEAQANLGIMYEEGRGGLRRDPIEAERLFSLAAAQRAASLKNRLP